MNVRLHCALLLLGLASLAAWAAEPTSSRERIVAERAEAQAKFADDERACRARFVVSACIEAARKEQRATLTRLRRQEVQLDEIRRQEAAAARAQAIRDKAAAAQARASDASLDAQRSDAPERKPRVAAKPGNTDVLPKSPASGLTREAEHSNEAKFKAKARAAQAHREAVEQRNAQRAAQGKVAAPLPLSGGASAP